ncbi:uncharacterized protein KQ657_002132 [Scheffersomyces spartinae]|uniref:Inner centromere protein ARK-binding domain-containing protein n=1 Tax=Scheffersomyces spartinae TaxID=45513 RepID=A0A9P7VD97_9ASCO|nr:uncharacterized protein KQ657_002132 [Scheffersomyces spartinae]KAG7195749.1 hypothetical protein KQ657_002132 [Scheffersomyces spartinae]
MSKRNRAPAGTGMYIAGELEYACVEKAIQGERVVQLYDLQIGALNETMGSLMKLISDGTVTQFMGNIQTQKRSIEREIELRSSISDFTFASPRGAVAPQLDQPEMIPLPLKIVANHNHNHNHRQTADPFLSPPKASATLTPKQPYRSTLSDSFASRSITIPVDSVNRVSLLTSTKPDSLPSSTFPNPDSSIEAIQLNIRESMKRRLTIKANDVTSNVIVAPKASNMKTPSRSSLFMKLPSKTPILDGVSWKSNKGSLKSRKVAERLEAEIAQQDLNLSPVVVPRVISKTNLEEMKVPPKLINGGEKNVFSSNNPKLRLSTVPTLNPQSSSTPKESNGNSSSSPVLIMKSEKVEHKVSRSTTQSQSLALLSERTIVNDDQKQNASKDGGNNNISHISPPKKSPGRIIKSPHKTSSKLSTFTSPTKSSTLKTKKPEIKRHPHIKTTNRLLNTELKTDLPPSILTLKPLVLPPREEYPSTVRKSRHEFEVLLRGNLALESNGGIPQLTKETTTDGSTPLKITRPPSYSYSSAKEYGPNKKVEDLLHAGRLQPGHGDGGGGKELSSNRQPRPLKGNAVPLPEAARGRVTTISRITRTPHRLLGNGGAGGQEAPKTPLHKRYKRETNTTAVLPDFGSDDEEVQKSDVLKEWATEKNLKAMISEQQLVNPTTIFGEIPEFDIDEVFQTYESRARARKSPMQWSTVERRKDEKRYARQMGYQ